MNVCFIYNPESGSGKITSYLKWIEQEFINHNHNIKLYETHQVNDAYYYAKEAGKYDMVLVAGGDGTLNEVVNGLMELEKRPVIGYIPTGTANDVGHLIGMKKNVKKTVRMILKRSCVKETDIVKINNKYFIYAAAAGKFTEASYDIERNLKKRFKTFAYFLRGSKDLFKDFKIPTKATFDNGTYNDMCSLILIINGRRIGGFKLFGIKNKLDDGNLSVRFFRRESWLFLRIAAFLLTGGLYDTRKNKTYQTSKITIETDNDVSWNTDGEFMGKGSIEIEVVPKAVRFIVSTRKVNKSYLKIK